MSKQQKYKKIVYINSGVNNATQMIPRHFIKLVFGSML